MAYRYRLIYRPAGYATLPTGVTWRFVELPRDDYYRGWNPTLPVSQHRYGVIETNRALTEKELRTFQIEAVA